MKTKTPLPLSLTDLTDLLPRLKATIQLASAKMNIADEKMRRSKTIAPASAKKVVKRAETKNTRDEAAGLRTLILRSLTRSERKAVRISQLADKVHATPEATRYALKQLREDGRVEMTGARATARWYAK